MLVISNDYNHFSERRKITKANQMRHDEGSRRRQRSIHMWLGHAWFQSLILTQDIMDQLLHKCVVNQTAAYPSRQRRTTWSSWDVIINKHWLWVWYISPMHCNYKHHGLYFTLHANTVSLSLGKKKVLNSHLEFFPGGSVSGRCLGDETEKEWFKLLTASHSGLPSNESLFLSTPSLVSDETVCSFASSYSFFFYPSHAITETTVIMFHQWYQGRTQRTENRFHYLNSPWEGSGGNVLLQRRWNWWG